jgi:BirA family transcriptional regulator, biotin operon repressor / biotin---[acetyl-CoA-carboxylase] ligase
MTEAYDMSIGTCLTTHKWVVDAVWEKSLRGACCTPRRSTIFAVLVSRACHASRRICIRCGSCACSRTQGSAARERTESALCAALECSTPALRDCVSVAGTLGPTIIATPGAYRLSEPLDLLDTEALRILLSRTPVSVEVLDRCSSTNSVLLERAQQGGASGTLLACEHQTAGRGRRGAQWLSPVGGSLAFSLLWRFEKGTSALSGLSLCIAVAIARALEPVAGPIAVKWPNDLLLSGRKLAGVLTEVTGASSGPCAAVIGVGVNVRLPAGAQERIAPPAIDLSAAGRVPSRTELLARVAEQLAVALPTFQAGGFAPFRDEWIARHAWQGCRVSLRIAGRSIAEGEAVGVAEDGALLLRSERGIEHFHAGELSLRRSPEPA